MTASPNLDTVFLAAINLPSAADRAAYIARACGDDPAFRDRVSELVAAHFRAGRFLDAPAPELVATVDQAPAEGPGTVVGPYRLMEQVGEGGMGVVFVAEQHHPVRRKVALKVIKPGMDTKEVVARFEAERQALALMDHPHIAKVLDAGMTDRGRPYFVMELVRGIPVTDYCDRARLGVRERLNLFVQVCQAVQHAHQKGVIHRDLKPSNVLVTEHDGTPVAKVIDFGVAKAVGQSLTDKTVYTRHLQLVGSPMYMSPEQAGLSGLDVDTRADIYALGVLLYELLTGTTPFDKERFKTAGYDEVRQIIREEDPPRPSTRLSTLGEAAVTVSANRGVEPRKLSALVRGELDWLVMKALEKDRNRRYESAAALAADVQRYLADEPVQACPPSAAYRVRKFARRNRGPVLAASLVVLALVGGMVGTTWGLLRATGARAIAVSEAERRQIALREREAALEAARASERARTDQLLQALLAQARANGLSRRSGQRFETLEILRRATGLARALDLPPDGLRELRDAAVATLALPDLHLAGPWNPWPADAFAFDFDEAHAVYARTDRRGDCSVRRVADDAEVHRLPGLGGPAFPHLSRDGKFVAVAHTDPAGKDSVAVHLWQVDGPTPRRLVAEAGARFGAFHPNAPQVAVAYHDGAIALFELAGGRQLSRLPPHTLTTEVKCALHPTDSLVAVCSYFGSVVQLRDTRTGEVVARLPQSDRPSAVAWDPDGRTLAVGTAESMQVRLYDQATFQPFRTLEARQAVEGLAFNHAGDRLAVTGWSNAVELFDVGTGQKLFTTLPGRGALRFSRDDRRLAGGVRDGRLGIWQVGDAREYRTLVRKAMPDKAGYTRPVTVSPDGRLLAVAMTDGFGLWDLAGGSELRFVPAGAHSQVLFEPSGALLALGSAGLFRWPVRRDPAAGPWVIGPPERLPLPCGSTLDQSADGRVIVTGSRAVGAEEPHAGGWVLRDDRPGRPIRLDAGADVGWIAVDPRGQWVVTATHPTGLAKVWDARDGRLVKQLAEWGAGVPCFSPDGRWLSTQVDGGRLFAAGTWEPGPQVGGRAVFARDRRLMAVETGAGVNRLVDPASGRELAAPEDPDFDLTHLSVFTPDGTKLIGYSNGKVKGIHVWDVRLIRRRLRELDLDWDGDDFPPEPAGQGPAPADPHPAARVVGAEGLVEWAVWGDRARAHARAGRWDEAAAAYSRAIEHKPDHGQAWSGRGAAFAELGRWDKAAADFEKAAELAPEDATTRYYLALVRLHLGDRDGYRKVCAEMLGRFGRSPDMEATRWVAWVAVLAPGGASDWEAVIGLAEKRLAADPKDPDRIQLLGAVLYRAGRFGEAARHLSEADAAFPGAASPKSSRVYTRLFQAMTQHRLGRGDEARRWLDDAAADADPPAPAKPPAGGAGPWNRRLTLQLLRREAEELLKE